MGASSHVLLSVSLLCLVLLQTAVSASRKPYVVYMGSHSHGHEASSVDYERVTLSHHSFLASYLGSIEKARETLINSYTKHINGFSAFLEEEEAKTIAEHPDVVSVFPSQARGLHTTGSWAFMGLERDGRVAAGSIWTKANFGEDIIIANLDTGVWPESKSFNDDGMGPVPSRWKGTCESDATGPHCNRKLIGMRSFSKGFEAAVFPLNASQRVPRDTYGHGTHTLSTAGGAFVDNAEFYGYGKGTAKGGSPRARAASYKVCWLNKEGEADCRDEDILAGFDQAIADGVDVISVSLGPDLPIPDYFQEGTAIGSFHAVMHGIVVVCAAGNSGRRPGGTVANVAPWIITVAASTTDRSLDTFVQLGNHKQLHGVGQSSGRQMQHKYYPLINSLDAKLDTANATAAQLCFSGALDPEKVKGKVVACLRGNYPRVDKGKAVLEAGGVGMVLANDKEDGDQISPDIHYLPTTHISYTDGLALYSYTNATKSPVAYIVQRTSIGSKPAPVMAIFSSRGPNSLNPEILKPDITAPGVHILAAFSEAVPPSGLKDDERRVSFRLMNGTSMSCPHVAGVAGLLRKIYPDWSPAAIRSAIMTTARSRDNTMEPMMNASLAKATPFNHGAGHIRPNRAQDPGLVYDIPNVDYLNFLCYRGYNSSQMASFSKGGNYTCPENWSILDMNYPSIAVPNLRKPTTITRTLKNVGTPATYDVRVEHLAGVSATVEPKTLTFEKVGEEKSYKLTLSPKEYGRRNIMGGGEYVFGRIIWSDGTHYVRSPIVVSA